MFQNLQNKIFVPFFCLVLVFDNFLIIPARGAGGWRKMGNIYFFNSIFPSSDADCWAMNFSSPCYASSHCLMCMCWAEPTKIPKFLITWHKFHVRLLVTGCMWAAEFVCWCYNLLDAQRCNRWLADIHIHILHFPILSIDSVNFVVDVELFDTNLFPMLLRC